MALQLKVLVPAKELSKQFRFNPEMSISEACVEIKEKTGEGGADHGLFLPPDDTVARKGQWLLPSKTLLYYNLRMGDTLMYKKKHRMLKIKLVDDTTKKILVDDSLTVAELTAIVGEHLGMKNVEEYSLKLEGKSSWLHPTRSLPEQNVNENDTVELRKKFFASDAQVDRSDALQVHFLYIQARDLVVSGQLPTQYSEACVLAGLQLQIEYSNFVRETHRVGWFNDRLEQCAHLSHQRNKNFAQDVLHEWRKVTGMSPINGKYRYLQMVRSLKTYGITCYEVEERTEKGPRKILLGIAAEKIFRMDYTTKEVYLQHPITHLRRYAATANTITLDFADYETEYMTFRTKQGEEILQLISGYIDIYLKKKRSTGIVVKDEEAEQAQTSEVAPVIGMSTTTYTSSIGSSAVDTSVGEQQRVSPAGMGGLISGESPLTYQKMMEREAQRREIFGAQKEVSEGQQEMLNEMNPYLDMIDEFEKPVGAMGGDYNGDEWRKKLAERMYAAGKSADELRLMAQHPDKTAIAEKQHQLLQQLAEMVAAARMAAASGSEEDIALLDGAHKVAVALARMLHCSKAYGAEDPRTLEALAVLQAAQSALGLAVQGSMITDKSSETLVMAYAESLEAAARRVAVCGEEAARTAVRDAAAKEQLATASREVEQLAVNVTRTTDAASRALLVPSVRDLVSNAVKVLGGKNASVGELGAKHADDGAAKSALTQASRQLADANGKLLLAVQCASALSAEDLGVLQTQLNGGVVIVEGSLASRDRIVAGTKQVVLAGDRVARIVTAHASTLPDAAARERVDAQLASFSTNLRATGEAAKQAIAAIHDGEAHATLVRNAQHTRDALDDLLSGDAGKQAAVRSLCTTAKQLAAADARLLTTARRLAPNVQDAAVQQRLVESAEQTAARMNGFMAAIAKANANADDLPSQLELVAAARQAGVESSALVAAASSGVPKLADVVEKKQLHQAATESYDSLQALLQHCNRFGQFIGSQEMEVAVQKAHEAMTALDALLRSAEVGLLPRGSVQNATEARQSLAMWADVLRAAGDQLVRAVHENPPLVPATVRALAEGVDQVASWARETAPLLAKMAQPGLVKAAKEVAQQTKAHVVAARAALADPSKMRTCEVTAKLLNDSLRALVTQTKLSEVSGRECDAVAREVLGGLAALQAAKSAVVATVTAGVDDKKADFHAAVEELDARSKVVSEGLARTVTAAKADDEGLILATRAFATSWRGFHESTVQVVSLAPAPSKGEIVSAVEQVSQETAKLLQLAKSVGGDASNAVRLDQALVGANTALRKLLSAALSASPGSQEYARALEIVAKALAALERPAAAAAAAGSSPVDEIASAKAFNDNARALGAAVGRTMVSADAQEQAQAVRESAAALAVLLQATTEIVACVGKSVATTDFQAAAKALAGATISMIQTVQATSRKAGARDAASQAQVADATVAVTEALLRLRALVPGQRECDQSLVTINGAIADLDSASLAASAGTLRRGVDADTLHGAEETVLRLAMTLDGATARVAEAAVSKPSDLMAAVVPVGSQVVSFAAATLAMAAASDASVQTDRIGSGKAVASGVLKVVKLSKQYSNDGSSALRAALLEAASRLKEDIVALKTLVESELSGLRTCDEALVAIGRASAALSAASALSSSSLSSSSATATTHSYQEARNRTEEITRSLIAGTVGGLLQGARTGDVQQVAAATKALGEGSQKLVDAVDAAASASSEVRIRQRLLQAAGSYLDASATLVRSSKAFIEAPKSEQLRGNLSTAFQGLAGSVQVLMTTVQEGAAGELDCMKAINELSTINNEMDEAVLFSSTGAFEARMEPGKSLLQYHEAFMQRSDELDKLMNRLADASKVSIEQVGLVSKEIASTTHALADTAKCFGYLLESNRGQQALLQDMKQLAVVTQAALATARDAHLAPSTASSGGGGGSKPNLDAVHEALHSVVSVANKEGAEVLVRLRLLQSAATAIGAAVQNLDNPVSTGNVEATAESVVQPLRVVARSFPVIVQDSAQAEARLQAIQETARGVAETLSNAKGALRLTSDVALRKELTGAVREVATATVRLLEDLKSKSETGEHQKQLMEKITATVTASRKLPGGEDLELEENELERQAESELQAAAKAIQDAAVRIMAATQPSEELTGISLQEAQISAAILEAARAIATATAILVQAAAMSQRELINKGRANKALNPYKKDPAWANGLMSAAQAVSGCIEDLVGTANDAAQKKVGDEHLVAAARAVAGSTARFVYASKVKSDPNSPSTRKLEEAAKATAAATQQLVEAAKAASARSAQASRGVAVEQLRSDAARARKQEFEIQVEISTLEKQLNAARQKLADLRKSEYARTESGGNLRAAAALPSSPDSPHLLSRLNTSIGGGGSGSGTSTPTLLDTPK